MVREPGALNKLPRKENTLSDRDAQRPSQIEGLPFMRPGSGSLFCRRRFATALADATCLAMKQCFFACLWSYCSLPFWNAVWAAPIDPSDWASAAIVSDNGTAAIEGNQTLSSILQAPLRPSSLAFNIETHWPSRTRVPRSDLLHLWCSLGSYAWSIRSPRAIGTSYQFNDAGVPRSSVIFSRDPPVRYFSSQDLLDFTAAVILNVIPLVNSRDKSTEIPLIHALLPRSGELVGVYTSFVPPAADSAINLPETQQNVSVSMDQATPSNSSHLSSTQADGQTQSQQPQLIPLDADERGSNPAPSSRRTFLQVYPRQTVLAQGTMQSLLVASIVQLAWIYDYTRALDEVFQPMREYKEETLAELSIRVRYLTLSQGGTKAVFRNAEHPLRELLINEVVKSNPQSFTALAYLEGSPGQAMAEPFISIELYRTEDLPPIHGNDLIRSSFLNGTATKGNVATS